MRLCRILQSLSFSLAVLVISTPLSQAQTITPPGIEVGRGPSRVAISPDRAAKHQQIVVFDGYYLNLLIARHGVGRVGSLEVTYESLYGWTTRLFRSW